MFIFVKLWSLGIKRRMPGRAGGVLTLEGRVLSRGANRNADLGRCPEAEQIPCGQCGADASELCQPQALEETRERETGRAP